LRDYKKTLQLLAYPTEIYLNNTFTRRTARPLEGEGERMSSWYHEERGKHHLFLDKHDEEAVHNAILEAAQAINEANYVVITTGAGMGVDSGIPDFRGGKSFWGKSF